ncbi:MAG: hypothetical protein FJ279_32695 [Planctomycetes bacterium]|nr:hypothetical protein [Planctomycetota bacterium]
MPRGHANDEEARLELHGQSLLQGAVDWDVLHHWWLNHNGRANTPNWDLASTCSIKGRRGLVLVEAKAHVEELDVAGKSLEPDASHHSQSNHVRIGWAIEEASRALARMVPGVCLSRDSHYQLANRVAFAWKLATMGLDVVLVYMGFTGDSAVGVQLRDQRHWRQTMEDHARGILPPAFFDQEIACGLASMQMLVRSRPCGPRPGLSN